MASGWNLWVWLVGVVVRRYIDILIIIITFPYSTCINSFLGSSILTSLFILKLFLFLFMLFLSDIANVGQRHSRLFKNRGNANIINNYIERTSTALARAGPETSIPHARNHVMFQESCS